MPGKTGRNPLQGVTIPKAMTTMRGFILRVFIQVRKLIFADEGQSAKSAKIIEPALIIMQLHVFNYFMLTQRLTTVTLDYSKSCSQVENCLRVSLITL